MTTRLLIRVACLGGAALLLQTGFAQKAACGGHGDRNSMTVSIDWLAEHLKDPDVVVLAVGQKALFDSGHIPGAQFSDFNAIHTMAPDGQEPNVELPPMDQLKSVFEKLGVSSRSHIVLYAMTANGTSITTRTFLTLDAMGLGARTSMLDGAFTLWQKQGKPVTTEAAVAKPGKIDLCPQNDIIAEREYVNANLHHAGVEIIDARTPNFYTGATPPNGQRAGHIPGAANIPFNTLYDADGKFKPADELKASLTGAGVKQGDRVVSYCHIGQQATVVYFVARYLGYDARLYDGSWEDWSAHKDLPAEVSK